jgi:hypothetical protein
MRSDPVALWMSLAFGAALVLAVTVTGHYGATQYGIDAGLAATARLSFLLFWPAYMGGALVTLFGPAFLPFKQHARALGLSFAAAHLVHLGLVGRLCWIDAVPAISTFLLFGTAAFWLYLIAFLSIGSGYPSLNPKLRKLLFTVGMNFIAYAFAVDFLQSPFTGGIKHIAAYLPFAVLAVAGPLLQLAAFRKRRLPVTKKEAFL